MAAVVDALCNFGRNGVSESTEVSHVDERIEFQALDVEDFGLLSASARSELQEWVRSVGFDPDVVTSVEIVAANDTSCTVFVTTHHVVRADVPPPTSWPRTAVRDVVEFPYSVDDGAAAEA